MTVCKIVNGQTSIEHHYNNNNRQSPLMSQSNPAIGFSNMVSSFQNNVLTCSFTREKSMPNVTNYFDVGSQKYYILTADGNTDSNGLFQINFIY